MGNLCTHLGPFLVNPFCLSHSANHPMWQLQLTGLEIRLRERRERRDSNAPAQKGQKT